MPRSASSWAPTTRRRTRCRSCRPSSTSWACRRRDRRPQDFWKDWNFEMRSVVKQIAVALAVVAGAGLAYGVAGQGSEAKAKELDMNKIFRCSATDKPGVAACDKARALILDNCTT